MATGHAVNIPHSVFDPVRTLTATIAAELGEASAGSRPLPGAVPDRRSCCSSITFVVNLTADLVVARHPQRTMSDAPTPADVRARPRRRRASSARETRRAVRSSAAMAAAMVVPLLLIVGYLVVAGAGRSLSLGVPHSTNPAGGMTDGRHLAGASSARSTSSASRCCVVGADRRAGGGLPERIRARQLVHPHHQPGGGEPRRRAQHRARAVRPRRLRAIRRASGSSILAASLTLAIMTLPVIIASTQGGAGGGADVVPRSLLERRRHPLADDPRASSCRTRSAAS